MRRLASIAFGLIAAVAAVIAAAVCLAVLELYLSGHGHHTLMDHMVIDDPASGTRLSIADLIAIFVSAGVGVLTARLTWPNRDREVGDAD